MFIAIVGLLLPCLETKVHAWSEHALLGTPIFGEWAPVRDAPAVKAETLESFIIAEQKGLEKVLSEEENWARTNLKWYRPRPDALAFAAGGDARTMRDRFCHAIRVNPAVRLIPYLQLLPGEEVGGRAAIPIENLTFLKDRYSWEDTVMVALSEGDTVSPLAVLNTAADEPDLGLDVGLFVDNNSEVGPIYGFGRQPFGNPNLEYGSQAPFHMGFYHETWIVYAFAGFLRETYPEYRIHLYKTLARFAFQTGHPYWGWRFAGWGLHYLADIAQPYHATVLPRVSTARALWISFLAMVGFQKPKANAIQIVSNRHLALERFLQIELRRAYGNRKTDTPLFVRLRATDSEMTYDDLVPRDRVAKSANAMASVTSKTIMQCMPARYVSDPRFEFGTSKEQSQLVDRIREEKGEKAVAKLLELCGDLLVSYRNFGRCYIRAILAAAQSPH